MQWCDTHFWTGDPVGGSLTQHTCRTDGLDRRPRADKYSAPPWAFQTLQTSASYTSHLTMANQKPINVGIVGYGNSARVFHLPYITRNPDLNVVAFVQRTPAPKAGDKSIRHCTVDYPTAKHYTTVADFLKDADVDLVLVLTGHGAHAEVAEQALLAGKHGKYRNSKAMLTGIVVVEKPFVISSAEAETVLAARDKSGKILSVFQSEPYRPRLSS